MYQSEWAKLFLQSTGSLEFAGKPQNPFNTPIAAGFIIAFTKSNTPGPPLFGFVGRGGAGLFMDSSVSIQDTFLSGFGFLIGPNRSGKGRCGCGHSTAFSVSFRWDRENNTTLPFLL
jgi:hypothetical protein